MEHKPQGSHDSLQVEARLAGKLDQDVDQQIMLIPTHFQLTQRIFVIFQHMVMLPTGNLSLITIDLESSISQQRIRYSNPQMTI